MNDRRKKGEKRNDRCGLWCSCHFPVSQADSCSVNWQTLSFLVRAAQTLISATVCSLCRTILSSDSHTSFFSKLHPGERREWLLFLATYLKTNQPSLLEWNCCAYTSYRCCTIPEVGTKNKTAAVFTLGEKGAQISFCINIGLSLGEHFEMFLPAVFSAAPQTYLFPKHK